MEFSQPSVGCRSCILVVEDDLQYLHSISRILTDAGYTVVPASNGKVAIDTILADPEQLGAAVVDLCLPEEGGFSVIQELRAKAPHAKIVAISEIFQQHSLEVAEYFGAAVAVRKPVSTEWLLGEIAAVGTLARTQSRFNCTQG
jgi:DNA-binding response OmpR family regulator